VQTDSDTEEMADSEREQAIEAAGIPDPDDRDSGPLGGA